MSLEAIKSVFDNLTSEAGRRAEQEYNTNSATHQEVDSIKVNVRSARAEYPNACHRLGQSPLSGPRGQSHHGLVLP